MFSPDVDAQTIEDLEKEKQDLQEENDDLRERIEALNGTISTLEKQIAKFEEMFASISEEDRNEDDNNSTEKEIYQVGDTIERDGIAFRVVDAYYTEERNSVIEEQTEEPYQVLMLDIYYENIDRSQYSPTLDFEVYYDDTRAKYYSAGDRILVSVSKGRHGFGSLAFQINGNPETIEVEYREHLSENDPVIIEVTPDN